MRPERAILDAALPLIMQAPKDHAKVEMLCTRPDFSERNFVDRISLTRAGGVENCRWSKHPWLTLPDGSGDPRIQVSILQRRILDMVWNAQETDAPHPGDTFIVDMDLSEANLPEGTILSVGTAKLKVSTKWNDACVKWKARYGQDALDWVRAPEHVKFRLRGVLCEIYEDGEISNGDILSKA